MQLRYVCGSVEASLRAAEGNHPTVGLSAPKQRDCVILLEFYQTFSKIVELWTLTRSLSSWVQYRTLASLHGGGGGGGVHPYCDSLDVMEKYLIALCSHVKAHRSEESIAQLHLRIVFHATFFGSHILSVSNIEYTAKPSADHKAPLLTLKNNHYNAGFCCSVFSVTQRRERHNSRY